jgi:hypothetical protein
MTRYAEQCSGVSVYVCRKIHSLEADATYHKPGSKSDLAILLQDPPFSLVLSVRQAGIDSFVRSWAVGHFCVLSAASPHARSSSERGTRVESVITKSSRRDGQLARHAHSSRERGTRDESDITNFQERSPTSGTRVPRLRLRKHAVSASDFSSSSPGTLSLRLSVAPGTIHCLLQVIDCSFRKERTGLRFAD